MATPVSEIHAALTSESSRARESFKYALYLTCSMRELCDAFFVHLSNTELRNEIVKHILARRDRRSERVPRDFIQSVLGQFARSSKRERVSLGTTLKELIDSLTQRQLRRFFSLQVLSEHVLDRKRAYLVSARIYDQEVDDLLWRSWQEYQDDGCLAALARNSSGTRLAQAFAGIWQSRDLRFSTKNSVLKRVAKHDFGAVAFLRNDAPIPYLSACVAAGRDISDEEAQTIAKTARSLRAFQYALWCLGMLGKRKALYDLLAEAPEVESGMPIEFWEASPLDYAYEPSSTEA